MSPTPAGAVVPGEGTLTAAFARLYAEAHDRIVARLRDAARPALVAAPGDAPFEVDNPAGMFTAEEWSALFDEIAADAVADQVVAGATDAAVAADVDEATLERVLRDHLAAIDAYGPQVARSVGDVIAHAMRERLTLNETVERLATIGPLSPTAARTTARTEAVAAVNGGMNATWQATGGMKRWSARDDARTRPAHARADGQTVPVELPFTVGGREAHYPGDARLPVALRVNCRCRVELVAGDDELGAASLAGATRKTLEALARRLGIRGRSRMGVEELRRAVWEHRVGLAGQPLDQLNVRQLRERARIAGIPGRARMTRAQLLAALRQAAPGPDRPSPKGRGRRKLPRPPGERDRFLVDSGYVTRDELAAAQRRARRKLTAALRTQQPVENRVETAEEAAARRGEVWREFGGDDTGYVPCCFCGARLALDPADGEPMMRVPLVPDGPLTPANVVPACVNDAHVVAATGDPGFRLAAPAGLSGKPRSAFRTLEGGDAQAYVNEHAPRLSGRARQVLDAYTDLAYRPINDAARARAAGTEPDLGRYSRAELAPLAGPDGRVDLDGAVDTLTETVHAQAVAEDLTVWRGVVAEPGSELHELLTHGGLGRGARMAEHGFVSTSLDRTVAERFVSDTLVSGGARRVLLQVRVPAGTPGLFAAQPAAPGQLREAELILPPGTELVVRQDRVVAIGEQPGDVVVLEVEAVPPAGVDRERPVPRLRGEDPAWDGWGDRGAALAVAADTRPTLDRLDDATVPAAYNTTLPGDLATVVVDAAVQRGVDGGVETVAWTTTMEVRRAGTPLGTIRHRTDVAVHGPGFYDAVATIEAVQLRRDTPAQAAFSAVLDDLETYWASQGVGEVRTTARGAATFAYARRGWDWDLHDPDVDKLGSRLADRLTQATPRRLRPYLQPLIRGEPVTVDPDLLAEEGWSLRRLREVARMQDRLRRHQPGDPAFPAPIEVAMVGRRAGETDWPGKRAMTGPEVALVKQLVGADCGLVASPGSEGCGISARQQLEAEIAEVRRQLNDVWNRRDAIPKGTREYEELTAQSNELLSRLSSLRGKLKKAAPGPPPVGSKVAVSGSNTAAVTVTAANQDGVEDDAARANPPAPPAANRLGGYKLIRALRGVFPETPYDLFDVWLDASEKITEPQRRGRKLRGRAAKVEQRMREYLTPLPVDTVTYRWAPWQALGRVPKVGERYVDRSWMTSGMWDRPEKDGQQFVKMGDDISPPGKPIILFEVRARAGMEAVAMGPSFSPDTWTPEEELAFPPGTEWTVVEVSYQPTFRREAMRVVLEAVPAAGEQPAEPATPEPDAASAAQPDGTPGEAPAEPEPQPAVPAGPPVAVPAARVEGDDYRALIGSLDRTAKVRDDAWRAGPMPSLDYSSKAKDDTWLSLYFGSGARYDIELRPDGSWRARWAPKRPAPTDVERAEVEAWLAAVGATPGEPAEPAPAAEQPAEPAPAGEPAGEPAGGPVWPEVIGGLPRTARARDSELRDGPLPSLESTSKAKDDTWLSLYFGSGARYDIERLPDGTWRARWAPTRPEPTDTERAEVDAWLATLGGTEPATEPEPAPVPAEPGEPDWAAVIASLAAEDARERDARLRAGPLPSLVLLVRDLSESRWLTLHFASGARFEVQLGDDGVWQAGWADTPLTKPPTPEEREQVAAWVASLAGGGTGSFAARAGATLAVTEPAPEPWAVTLSNWPELERVVPDIELIALPDDWPLPDAERAARLAEVADAHWEWEQATVGQVAFDPGGREDGYEYAYVDLDAPGAAQDDYARLVDPSLSPPPVRSGYA